MIGLSQQFAVWPGVTTPAVETVIPLNVGVPAPFDDANTVVTAGR
jgi:hypothetical protein